MNASPEKHLERNPEENLYLACSLCPRSCKVNRFVEKGICGASEVVRVGRAALHWWEEPPLVGSKGSGAVFFSYCSLKCIYCQNRPLVQGQGTDISLERLKEIFLELQNEQGAANINLVTPSHYVPSIAGVLRSLRKKKDALDAMSLHVPVVYNTSSYEGVRTLRQMAGLVDIYLADYKYADSQTAGLLSHAPDYPVTALHAIDEMLAQVSEWRENEEGLLQKGIIVRHLVLPGYIGQSMQALKMLHERYGSRIRLSIMSQYTPPTSHSCDADTAYAELERLGLDKRLENKDYERVLNYADDLGIKDYFWQEGNASKDSFIPCFDGTGVI